MLIQSTKGCSVVALQKKYLANPHFLKTFLTSREIHYCKSKRYPAEPAAARLAAKQACLTLFKVPAVQFSKWFCEIEIAKQKDGKPFLKLSSRFRAHFKIQKKIILVSLAHERTYAVAWVAVTDAVSRRGVTC